MTCELTFRAIAMDETMYPNPDKFIPERFFSNNEDSKEIPMDPRTYVSGIGRRHVTALFTRPLSSNEGDEFRICPGLHFADLAIFMTIVSTLATTTITKALDVNGNEIPIHERRSGTVVK